MSKAHLTYFDARGLGEYVRLTLAATGVEFTEDFAKERSDFLKWREEGLMLFGQLPVLEMDGQKICQSMAIVRFLARRAGIFGKTQEETTLIDMYAEGGRDFYKEILPMMFQPVEKVLKNATDKALPKNLPIWNKILLDNGNCGYLVGPDLTLADISLLEALLVYVEYLGKDIFKEYPAVEKFYHTLTSLPRIASYLSGPQRPRKNDQAIVDTTRRVLDLKA